MPDPSGGATKRGRLTWRAATSALLFVAVLGACLTARAVWVWRAVVDTTAQQLAFSLDATGPAVALWRDAYVAQATLLARLAALDPDLGRVSPSVDRARFDTVLAALDTRHGILGGWIYSADGQLLAGSIPAPPAPSAVAGAARVITARDPGGTHADVAATVGTASGTSLGTVLLRVRVTDTTFAGLNPTHPDDHGGRTTLLARDGDSVRVVATATSDGDVRVMPRTFALAAVPTYVRTALDGRATHGHGRGVDAPDVLYAGVTVPALGWALVREQRADVVLALVRPVILREASVFAVIGILFAVTVVVLVRGVQARRATTLAQLRADFVSAVSHELRTPLAQIRLFAELLRKGGLRDEAEADRALGIIEKEAGRLTILVDNILSYTSLRRRQRFVTPLAADVPAEVRQVIESFAPLAAERGARVLADLEPGIRARVDTQALRQVLLNFLENAVKYGPKGQTVTVGARQNGARVRVWVDDEGRGVPAAERTAIWEAFYRTESAQRSGVGGSGLGLAVVHDLVAQYGGAVRVEDAPNGGARFVAEIPGL